MPQKLPSQPKPCGQSTQRRQPQNDTLFRSRNTTLKIEEKKLVILFEKAKRLHHLPETQVNKLFTSISKFRKVNNSFLGRKWGF